jgi:lipid II:glycine glycyltransferase (peptidoglycan interpeptide bridge formation enzyme)
MEKFKEEVGQITDLRQSPSYAKFMESIGWGVVEIGSVILYIKKLTLFGVIVRIPRANLPLPLEEIDQLARKKRVMLVKIEPNLVVNNDDAPTIRGFHKDSFSILPTKTVWIDLTRETEKSLSTASTRSRRHLRQAQRAGVVIIESDDWQSFYKLWSDNAKKKGFFDPYKKELSILWREFHEKFLLTALYDGKVVGGVLLLGYKEAVYYMLAMSTDEGRAIHAPYLLMWEAINRSKRRGYKRLDLEGVSDPEGKEVKDWAGFSHFKKGFGGREVRYAGSFSKSYSLMGKLLRGFI